MCNGAAQRCATGGSSGGICAFSCAFFRPDLFGKAISWIGSFTNIRGGHNYPWLVRNTPRKPIAVYLQEGTNDLSNQHGSWPLGNREMESALSYSGYNFHMEWGKGCHSGRHMAAILPQALAWVFTAEAEPAGGGHLVSKL
jgi:enterochelin esterase-like enzyme